MDNPIYYVIGVVLSIGGFALAFARARFTLGKKIGELEQWKTHMATEDYVAMNTHREQVIRSQQAIDKLESTFQQRHNEILSALKEMQRSLIAMINDRDHKMLEIIKFLSQNRP